MNLCLFNLEQTGVIILNDQGATYFNQAGGANGAERFERGYFVPISNDAPKDQPELSLECRLTELTKDSATINSQTANAINQLLMEISSSDRYEIDMDRLTNSCEAWIYLKVYPQGDYSTFGNNEPFNAVLTWPNSQ